MKVAIVLNPLLPRNDTTRYRHCRKIFPRFCDFLLTAFSRRLILPIQIRGTWTRQTDRVGDALVRHRSTLQPGITAKNEREVPAPRKSYASAEPPLFGRVYSTGIGQRIRFFRGYQGRFPRRHEFGCRSLGWSCSTLANRGVKYKGSPLGLREPVAGRIQDGYGEACIEWKDGGNFEGSQLCW